MTRMMVFLTTLMFSLPSDGSGQVAPSPGDRIRIRQVDRTATLRYGKDLPLILTGTFSTRSEETIQLSVGAAGPMVEVPIEGIEALEISLGRQRRFLKNFGLTVAATSILLGTLGFIAYEPGDEFFSTRTDLTGFGFLLGAYLGVPLGALIGYLVKEERWNPASLPAPAESRLTIRPVIGSGVGFAASIRVGGF